MVMDMQQEIGRDDVIDMDTQHVNGHTVWTWTCSINMDMDMDMQHGFGHAVWTWRCSRDLNLDI
jgi:hypothetical protein